MAMAPTPRNWTSFQKWQSFLIDNVKHYGTKGAKNMAWLPSSVPWFALKKPILVLVSEIPVVSLDPLFASPGKRPKNVLFQGPLMHQTGTGLHVLVGVVSYGPQGCVDPTLPNVYARVTDVLQWIFSVIKDANTCLPAESSLKAKIRHLSY